MRGRNTTAYPVLTEGQQAALWSKIKRGEPDECWPWTAATKGPGHGAVRVNGVLLTAHRVVWELSNGPAPLGSVVAQTCRNHGCCNPSHLKCMNKSEAMLFASAAGVKLGRAAQPKLKLPATDYVSPTARPLLRPAPSVEARFWSYVDRKGPDECWLWVGGQSNGYGGIRIDGETYGAHRVSYVIEHGYIAPDKDASHLCDNSLCVNPAHLAEESRSENMAGGSARGRPIGGHRPRRLTDTQYTEIKTRAAAGEPIVTIAKDYPVTPQHVGQIARQS